MFFLILNKLKNRFSIISDMSGSVNRPSFQSFVFDHVLSLCWRKLPFIVSPCVRTVKMTKLLPSTQVAQPDKIDLNFNKTMYENSVMHDICSECYILTERFWNETCLVSDVVFIAVCLLSGAVLKLFWRALLRRRVSQKVVMGRETQVTASCCTHVQTHKQLQ